MNRRSEGSRGCPAKQNAWGDFTWCQGNRSSTILAHNNTLAARDRHIRECYVTGVVCWPLEHVQKRALVRARRLVTTWPQHHAPEAAAALLSFQAPEAPDLSLAVFFCARFAFEVNEPDPVGKVIDVALRQVLGELVKLVAQAACGAVAILDCSVEIDAVLSLRTAATRVAVPQHACEGMGTNTWLTTKPGCRFKRLLTPRSDQCQNSPVGSPERARHTVGRFRKHNATPNRDVTCLGMAWARLPVNREVASAWPSQRKELFSDVLRATPCFWGPLTPFSLQYQLGQHVRLSPPRSMMTYHVAIWRRVVFSKSL